MIMHMITLLTLDGFENDICRSAMKRVPPTLAGLRVDPGPRLSRADAHDAHHHPGLRPSRHLVIPLLAPRNTAQRHNRARALVCVRTPAVPRWRSIARR